MSRKICIEEFEKRFYKNHSDSKIEIVEYTAISKPCKIKCLKCGKIHIKPRARDFISQHFCCETNYDKIDKIKEMLKNSDYEFVKKIDKDCVIIRHKKCGNEQKRTVQSAFDNPCSCDFCKTKEKSFILSLQQAQEQINSHFGAPVIQILEYNGQPKKNKYKCLQCGLIFNQQHTRLLQSRGCPHCQKWKNKGEAQIENLLKQNKINFISQYKIPELKLQSFDFAVLDEQNNLSYLIEVQGERHFEKREIFQDSLEKIQERDNRKREYCKKHGIKLYELVYKKGKILNFDILPLSSTTISAKGE